MNRRNNTQRRRSFQSKDGIWESGEIELISEEPLMIRIDENPYAVVMRTPGDEVYHATGFCLGEGIIETMDDISNIGYDVHADPNVIDLWLTGKRRKEIPAVLERQSYVSKSSCGICGKRLLEDLYQNVLPADDGPVIPVGTVATGIDLLSKKQKHYFTTRGSHAALILDHKLEVLGFAEDVGRHNALDKAIGEALSENRLSSAVMVVLSSRNSHELVQKAARAHIPVMISHSRPTTLAIEMGSGLNMTLCFPGEGSGLIVMCGKHRIAL